MPTARARGLLGWLLAYRNVFDAFLSSALIRPAALFAQVVAFALLDQSCATLWAVRPALADWFMVFVCVSHALPFPYFAFHSFISSGRDACSHPG